MARQTKAPKADTAAARKDGAANRAGKTINLDDVLAYIETLPKGSDELKAARNIVWRKIAAKEPKPELVSVLREAVKLHGFDDVKLAFGVIRKENNKGSESEMKEAE
jgi:hypothetical protein